MYFVYVLCSLTSGHFYTGFTSNPVQRLGQHNQGITKSTRNRGPWEIVLSEGYPTRWEAMRRERFLKSGKGREQLKQMLSTQSARNSAG